MDYNQVYRPSGISTRAGVSNGVDAGSVPSSAGGFQLLEQNSGGVNDGGLVTRPTTNQTTRYEANYPLSTNPNSYISTVPSFLDKFSSNSQSTSQTLYNRISKWIKAEKKIMKQKNEFIKDINSWCNILPNDDSKKLMYHYIKILETELESDEKFLKKKDQINVQLLNVNKREKRTNDLKLRRNKMLIKLRDNENKIGDSPITILTKENLEELECSVEIVEDQFIRSVNIGLKNSIIDYVLCLRDSSNKYSENCKLFLDNYYFSSTKLGSDSNLQRLILQNKLNSSSVPTGLSSAPLDARPVSNYFENKHKYVAISQNQIGKYIDNKYDTENSVNSNTNQCEENGKVEEAEEDDKNAIPSQVKNPVPTFLRVSTQDYNPLNITSEKGPPPTSEFDANHRHHQQQQSHEQLPIHQQNNQLYSQEHGVDAAFIINSYSTPGSLAIRPISQLNHQEWTN